MTNTQPVLLIDDDLVVSKLVSAQLGALGYHDVTTAHSGAAALDLMCRRHFEIIISDLSMPEMDGVELLRNISKLNASPGIIVMSGLETRILDSVHNLALASGLRFLGAVSKPVDMTELSKLLAKNVFLHTSSQNPAEISEQELAQGLRRGAVDFVLQPKLRLRDMAIVGAEALARWRDAEGRLLAPSTFIHVAQRSGRLADVTYHMIEHVLSAVASAELAGEDFAISFNVAIDDLKDVSFADHLLRRTRSAGVNPEKLVIEVTETGIIRDWREALDILSRLRMNGIGLAIDDFGIGASGFENLQKLPFNELKIDRSFVRGAASNPKKRIILQSMLDVARALELVTVAEGVEDSDDITMLTSMGCDLVQGFYFAQPMPLQRFLKWCAEHNESRELSPLGSYPATAAITRATCG